MIRRSTMAAAHCLFATPARRSFAPVVLALVAGAGLAATLAGGVTMAGMGGTPMPGGWTLSAAWRPICGEGWSGVAASFVGMWVAMTAAMMTPVVAPVLVREGSSRTWALGAGYAAVWIMLGVTIFTLGAAVGEAAMRASWLSRACPFLAAAVVLVAGGSQFTAWKARRLAACCAGRARAGGGWSAGVRLGLRCAACCAGPTAVLLMLGAMNLGVMSAVALAIILERLAPDSARWARLSGAAAITAGLVMVVRAVALA